MKSEMRGELKIWDSRKTKKNGMTPVVKKGSGLQLMRFLIEMLEHTGEEFSADAKRLKEKHGWE